MNKSEVRSQNAECRTEKSNEHHQDRRRYPVAPCALWVKDFASYFSILTRNVVPN